MMQARRLIHYLPAQLILDMCTDNIVERSLGLKAEIPRALCIELLGPAGNNSLNKLVRCAPDARNDLLAGDAVQSLDLLSDGTGYTGHGEIDARPELVARQPCRVDKKADSCARTRVRMAHAVGDRQQRLLTRQRFANDAGEKPGGSLVGFARAHADSR